MSPCGIEFKWRFSYEKKKKKGYISVLYKTERELETIHLRYRSDNKSIFFKC